MPENFEVLIKRCYQCGTCTGACPSAKLPVDLILEK